MKVTKAQAAKNRERMLDATSRLIRERGLAGSGVDALTGAAGLTTGSIYSQFGSKDHLIAEALSFVSGRRSAARTINKTSARDFITSYLSVQHRDNPGGGCYLAVLGPEIPRQGKEVRRTFTEKVRENISWLTSVLPGKRKQDRETKALATMSMLVGTMVLARAVDDPAFSERILSMGRSKLLDEIGR